MSDCFAADPHGRYEWVGVSPFYSKGRVSNFEIVYRFVEDPNSFDEADRRQLNDAFFENVFTQGFSVQRVEGQGGSLARVHKRGAEVTAKRQSSSKPRAYLGVVAFKVADLRAVSTPGDSPTKLRVYDTAERLNPPHAEAMLAVMGTKAEQRQAKAHVRLQLLNQARRAGLSLAPNILQDDPRVSTLGIALHFQSAKG